MADRKEKAEKKPDRIIIFGVTIAAVMVSVLAIVTQQPVIMALVASFCIILAAFAWQPCIGLYIILLIVPIISISFFEQQIFGIPGFKISVLLPLLSFIYLFLVGEKRKIYPIEARLLGIYFILFTVAVFRSYGYLAERNIQLGEEFSWIRHIMTNYLRPLLTFWLLYFITAYVADKQGLKTVVLLLLVSMVIAFIATVFAASTSKNFNDFNVIRETIGYFVGTHPGYYANFFLVLCPLTLLLAIKTQKVRYFIVFFLEIFCIGITFSRASYLIVLLMIIMVLLIEKKWKQLIGLFSCVPVIVMLMPPIVMKRMMTGITDNNVNEVSAGRLDKIWEPILQDLSVNPRMLLVGNGRYGVYDTNVSKSGAALGVNNAHNILLDMICDSGIIGMIFFVIFFGCFLIHFYKEFKSTSDEYIRMILLGIMIGVCGFLLKGITDGVFWAEAGSNAMVYVLIGLGSAAVHISRESSGAHSMKGESAHLDQ